MPCKVGADGVIENDEAFGLSMDVADGIDAPAGRQA